MSIQIERGQVVEVARGAQRPRLPGMAMVDSMVVVWKHWVESFRKNRDFSDIHGTFTQEYPEEAVKLPEAYRNMPILLYDDETGHELCTSCYQCARICPPQVIHMTQAKDPVTGKAVPAVAEFIIEYDACMSCGFCAEICPFDSIKMDHVFELSTADHPSLTVTKQDLGRPISYYIGIAPTLWAEVKDSALKKLQGSIKRRPDVLGIAPHLTEKLAARRRELAVAAASAPLPLPAPPAAAPADGKKLTPEEKAAKLAAIRAGKGGAPAPVAPPPAAAPADDKAAKLAAIRAKNAAGKGETAPPAAPVAPADDKAAKLAAIRAKNAAAKGETAPPPAAPVAPADDKAAKLAAIRAKNAAAKGETAPPPPPEAPPEAPVDAKAAKLAAIRAANAAKKAGDGSA